MTLIPKQTKWIWFDLDDTLIDFTSNASAALRRLYADYDLGRWFTTAGRWVEIYERHNVALWEAYARGAISQPKLRLDRFLLPFREAGADEATAMDFARRFDTLYLDYLAEETRLVEGCREVVGALRNAGYRIGILSNGFTEVQHRKIANCGLTALIDLVVLSDDIGVNKPDRRLYEYASAKAGAVKPEENLMVGDNRSTDIAGAVGAGWNAIWFDRHATGLDAPDGATAIRRLAELTDTDTINN